MNILFVIDKLQGGGAERVVARLTSKLVENNRIYIALTNRGAAAEAKYEHDERVEIVEVSPHRILRYIPFRAVRRPASIADSALKLRSFKKKAGIDISVSFLESGNIINALADTGEPIIISVRNMISRTFRSARRTRAWNAANRNSEKHADRVVCVSKIVAAEQRDLYGVPAEKLVTIYNPIDAEAIRAGSLLPVEDERFGEFRKKHDKILITAGRLHLQKSQWQMIRCMRGIIKEHPSAGLVIMGKGPLEGKLRDVIAANGLEDHVYLAGYHLQPYNYYGNSDVFVMTSHHEGFSNAMLEAAACGLPVVSVDCDSGPRELLAPDTDPAYKTKTVELAEYGILTPVLSCDPDLNAEPLQPEEQMFAKAVCMLLDDPALMERYGRRIKERAGDFSPETICGQWESLFGELG